MFVMSESKLITEAHKLKLVEHIVHEVSQGLSGRDGKDLIDISPSRAIFAGVLQTPRKNNVGVGDGTPPADTSLGLDFRVELTGEKHATLTVKPRWSFYYPVFPAYEDVLFANPAFAPNNSKSETAGKSAVPIETPAATQYDTPVLEAPSSDDEEVESEVEDDPKPSGTVSLPRVFKRYDVVVGPINVQIGASETGMKIIGEAELAQAIQKANLDIRSDARLWRHLSTPSAAERRLSAPSILKSKDAYEQALAKKGMSPVDLPPWSVSLQIEIRPDTEKPETLRIRILLSNTTNDASDFEGDRLLEERAVLDAKLQIKMAGCALVPFEFLLAPKDYRSKPQTPARGINCTAKWQMESAQFIESETLPLFKQPYYRTREGVEVTFDKLVGADLIPTLEAVVAEMDKYVERWRMFLESEKPATWSKGEAEACDGDRKEFTKEIQNYRLGIETLKRDQKLAEAFRLMNRAFAKLAKVSGGRLKGWRLFQIGFIVSQLPALAVRELTDTDSSDYAQRLREMLNEVGVLWFPTGGGKTESYLGLIAASLLFDRLRGKRSGVSAWMRFPLRMLSLQQLERLARVIAALNELRSEVPKISGGDPFAIGYYVGDAVTPNSVNSDRMSEVEFNKGAREKLLFLRKCPFCGSEVEIKAIRQQWRIAHVCTNQNCFSNKSDSLGFYKGTLPLCVVDNEIYRYLPSVLVGTVDKLAIIARSRFFCHIVRGASQRCPIHGYTSYDECIERGSWSANCTVAKKKIENVAPFKDPGPSLLIQDELHLLRAELGVFNGHYEGLLRHLGDKAYLRPKVLAATATIEAYDTHTFHVYLSRSRRYPQPSWENGESFYATSKPIQHRRLYLGVLNQTKGIEDSIVRAMTLYLRGIRRLRHDLKAAALVMGIPDAEEKDIASTLRLYDLSLCYVNKKATGGSLSDKMAHIEHLLSREGLGEVKHQFLHGDQPAEYIGNALERIEKERAETTEARLDVVIATNLISHGVDLERINMMTVAGMPSHYAEYVQSTSRAARSHPGIVFVCFKSRDPREHSQYEFFTEMHEHMERLIEAVAVNRFASFAPRKTVPGLLSALLLCDYSPRLFGSQINKPLDHIPTLQIALGLKAGTTSTVSGCVNPKEIQNTIEEIIGVDKVRPPASVAQIDNVKGRVAEAFEDQMGAIGRSMEAKLAETLKPITSFRDVDEGIDFGSKDSAMIVGRLRAK
jgi:hypothetical protein